MKSDASNRCMQLNKVKPIPEGYHAVTPYLVVTNASGLITFLQNVLEATVTIKHVSESGAITHSEMKIGDSMVMLADATERTPPMPAMILVYVTDSDAAYKRAMKEGAVSLREPADQAYGDRTSGVKDSWGNQWWFATHIEDVSPEEMQRRLAAHSGN